MFVVKVLFSFLFEVLLDNFNVVCGMDIRIMFVDYLKLVEVNGFFLDLVVYMEGCGWLDFENF